LAAEKQLAS